MYHNDNNTITTEYVQHDEKVLGGIGTVLFKYISKHGNKIAQIDAGTGETDTYESILKKCIRFGIVLQNKGIKRGDIITYYSGIHRNAIVPVVSSIFIGAVPSFLDDSQTLREVTHLLKHTSPKLIITDTKYLQKVKDIADDSDINIEVFELNENALKYQEGEDTFKPVYVNDLNELAIIHFSSGSTGLPKGICLNHYRFLIMEMVEEKWFWKDGQNMVIYSNDSFYWTTETTRLVSSVRQGACRLFNSEKFDPKRAWLMLEKYKVNMAFLIPFDILQMCQVGKPDNLLLDSLTILYFEGAPLPKQYEIALRKMLPSTDMSSYYGQTEIGLLLMFTKSDQHKEYSRKKIGSTGMPFVGPGTSYKVVDLETGKNLGPNREGELRVKCRTVMLGYNNLDSSERFDEEGWLKTGDLAYYDEDYCFYIVGRIKELILYQGWHITPASLEAELLTHPSVQRAVVIGVPHHLDGERPIGVVTVHKGIDVSAREIEEYMKKNVPNRPIMVKIVGEIQTTANGKVKREVLRKMVLANEI